MSSPGRYKAPKGMQDILPPDIYIWQKVERIARTVFFSYGFQELRPPVAESTDVFIRSIGENTDIVEKEMYTFHDKAGRSMTLRPEGTAPVVRCYVEHNLHNLPSPQKFYYMGPMFRYERPQAGRYRQFYQIGVESFGSASPMTDAEAISMLMHLLAGIGLKGLACQVNSIGCETCRPGYRETLIEFFRTRLEDVCPDCRRRYTQNPLRLLDCKVERCVASRDGAPKVTDFLCRDCKSHFEELLQILDRLSITHTVNPNMVRGLDYYTRTTFEVTGENLGAQNTVAAGGRYDRLVKEFGGPETPAFGFAIGMERIVSLLKSSVPGDAPKPQAFIAAVGEAAAMEGMVIADRLRKDGVWVETGDHLASLKSQMRRADRLSAEYVLILGDQEIASRRIKWKRLSDAAEGETAIDSLQAFLAGRT